MKFKTLLLIAFFSFYSCEKNNDKEEYLECLQFEIDEILNSTSTTIKANIKKYKYHGVFVYAFYEGNVVEGQTRIYNEKCLQICEFGGIGGSQISTCENWDSAEFIETVWEDPR